jgi:hypothetical protein
MAIASTPTDNPIFIRQMALPIIFMQKPVMKLAQSYNIGRFVRPAMGRLNDVKRRCERLGLFEGGARPRAAIPPQKQ